jgi:capsular exopolysaccharide synthesis family protein
MDWVDTALKRADSAKNAEGRQGATDQRQVRADTVFRRHLDRFPVELPSEAKARAGEPHREVKARELPTPQPVVRVPPPAGTAPYRTAFSASMAEKLVVMTDTSPIVVEQFRKLAATLHEMQRARTVKAVMVASAVSGEGKTFTAMNLALTLSESFRDTVLLVDADFRRPRMHEHFLVPGVHGVTAPDQQSQQTVQITPTLTLLPAGRPDPDPMRVLTSDRMRRLIADAAARFDWVILDSPPVADLPDGHLLASMVDAVVIVAAAGRTPYTAIARAVDTIGRDRVAGMVLNHVEDSALSVTRELAWAYVGAAPEADAGRDHE